MRLITRTTETEATCCQENKFIRISFPFLLMPTPEDADSLFNVSNATKQFNLVKKTKGIKE